MTTKPLLPKASFMANPLTNFITSRFIDPAVERRLAATVTKDTNAFAVGVML
jgi:hypothetical protein